MSDIRSGRLLHVDFSQTLPAKPIPAVILPTVIALSLRLSARMRAVPAANHDVATFELHDRRVARRALFGMREHGDVRGQLGIVRALLLEFLAGVARVPGDRMSKAHRFLACVARIVASGKQKIAIALGAVSYPSSSRWLDTS